MLIVCPNCATSYQVQPSSLGATGRSVRCVRCKKVWFASNTEAMAAIALSHHQDMAALSGVPVTAGAMDDAMDERFPEPPGEPADAFDRDDRGPAPLPDPRDYDLPPAPVVVDDAPALVPGDHEEALQPAIEAVPENIETVAARRIRKPPPRRRQSRWPISGWTAASLLLLAINIGLVAFRADIVRLFPQTASIYAAVGFEVNLRGLVFTEIVTRKDAQDGTSMLVVEGVIKSTSKRDITVPRLRFAIRDAKGHEVYSWTAQPARNTIAPGTTMPFRSRLASPPPEAHAVLVRFFNRRDLVAGMQ